MLNHVSKRGSRMSSNFLGRETLARVDTNIASEIKLYMVSLWYRANSSAGKNEAENMLCELRKGKFPKETSECGRHIQNSASGRTPLSEEQL